MQRALGGVAQMLALVPKLLGGRASQNLNGSLLFDYGQSVMVHGVPVPLSNRRIYRGVGRRFVGSLH